MDQERIRNMSVKQSEYKDDSITYHKRMRHQVKIKLEPDVAGSRRPVISDEIEHDWCVAGVCV